MKEDKTVLEIPVFGAFDQYFDQFMETNNNVNEKKYHDFVLKEYAADDSHIVYFYFMDYIPETGSASLIDQIIPKAPFSFFLVDSKEGLQEEATRNLIVNYCDKYSTPVFLIVKKDPLEFYTNIVKDSLVEENSLELILIENDSENVQKTAIVEAIKKVTPVNI
ncbi:MAG: hypothetical protein D8M58_15330 [Calditrichaeota bacterium]|nr:MAG: hypothetical protein DWQ03_16570 [Calditrichota bacterium]MBL1206775.1 hypothetical protein [Calditrichota bacterium]NOG46601.1 hypothetical protein [Calditrichota bacterium]